MHLKTAERDLSLPLICILLYIYMKTHLSLSLFDIKPIFLSKELDELLSKNPTL